MRCRTELNISKQNKRFYNIKSQLKTLIYKQLNKMITDALLRNYVDEVFMTYDRDRSGSLEPNQLANFFNDIFEKMHNPNRYTMQQANQVLRRIDTNFDGRATKPELFNALKKLMSQNQYSSDDYHGNNSRISGVSSQNNSYLSNNSRYEYQNRQNYGQSNMNMQNGQNYSNGNGYTLNNGYQNNMGLKYNQNSMMSTTYNQESRNIYSNQEPQVSYVDATRVLQPSTLISNVQQPILVSSTISQPEYQKISTVTAPGYTKITTETHTSTIRYQY